MKKISIITLFPDMVNGFFRESIVKRATEKNLVEIELINLRDFAINKYGSVDDRPYGGGAGMILRIEPLYNAIQSVISNFPQTNSFEIFRDKQFPISKKNLKLKIKTVLTSPKGKQFSQKKAQEYAKLDHLIIVAGHYEGVDERVLKYMDEEISLGDFVMTGGEIAAAAITDAVVRLIPGVLKKENATQLESYFEVPVDELIKKVGPKKILQTLKDKKTKKIRLLEYPQYTRPEVFQNKKVPPVLLSGNHKEIEKWRLQKAFSLTLKKRKDLLAIIY